MSQLLWLKWERSPTFAPNSAWTQITSILRREKFLLFSVAMHAWVQQGKTFKNATKTMLVTLPAPQNKNVPQSQDMLLTLSSTPEIIREYLMQRALTILTNSLSSGICIKPDKNWNQPQIPTADLCIPATSSLQTPKRLLLVAHGESPNPTSSVSRTERSADKGNPETSFSSSQPPSELGGGGHKGSLAPPPSCTLASAQPADLSPAQPLPQPPRPRC